MKYLAQINPVSGGCYRFNSDSLEAIRGWAKKTGRTGDTLTILRNGEPLKNAKVLTI